jgi:hypothetical protein
MSAQRPSHSVRQHTSSIAHTHSSQAGSSQPGWLRPKQQLLPGTHEHASAHSPSCMAISTQRPSHSRLQQKSSTAQTHVSQADTSQPGGACGAQQSPSPATSQAQRGSHSARASSTQVSSQTALQQTASRAQTQLWQST